TSCVEVRAPDGTLIVLDCGTGAHDLGQALMASGQPVRGHLLITHTHWDHIQGFPFFAPLFVPGNEWDVYAPSGLGRRLEVTLAGQMEYTYFPVTLEQLGATIRYHEIMEGVFDLGSVRITARYLNHPAIALGYRLEVGGVALVYATDHEPHAPPGDAARGEAAHLEDQRHREFLAGADMVIHDSQYTLQEYPQKVGWGHSPAEYVADVAAAAGVRRLALYHHDPLRDDESLDRLVAVCQERVSAAGRSTEVFGAAEGQVIDLTPREKVSPRGAPTAKVAMDASGVRQAVVLVVDDDDDTVNVLTMTLWTEGFQVLSASNGNAALEIARASRPDLMLLDWMLPGRDGLEVCRELRADADPHLRDLPVVLLTGHAGDDNAAIVFAAGVTDYVTKPFSPAYIRSRVHTWLLRRRAGSIGGA
ncbi:MAG TPA: response regulator, partial [Candidatus Limnocylindrales bacterium]|nr:response regulator [Candidatus Limnocylindrales bacterium]